MKTRAGFDLPVALFAIFAGLVASPGAARPQASNECDKALLPQVEMSTMTLSERLAYLELIDETNFSQEKDSGRLGAILPDFAGSGNFENLQEQRNTYRNQQSIKYSSDEARAYFRQSLHADQLTAWATCMTSTRSGVRIILYDDRATGVSVKIHFAEGPGIVGRIQAEVIGGTFSSNNSSRIKFTLGHDGDKPLYVRRQSPSHEIRIVASGNDMGDVALSEPPPRPEKGPVYVRPEMISRCFSRGKVCNSPAVTLGGISYTRGIVFTQPGEQGGGGLGEADFAPVLGKHLLRFIVGNYYEGADCSGQPAVQMSVKIDGKTVWRPKAAPKGRGIQDYVGIPQGSQKITLVGERAGPIGCADAVWVGVNFDN
jgi:hypothetical protein